MVPVVLAAVAFAGIARFADRAEAAVPATRVVALAVADPALRFAVLAAAASVPAEQAAAALAALWAVLYISTFAPAGPGFRAVSAFVLADQAAAPAGRKQASAEWVAHGHVVAAGVYPDGQRFPCGSFSALLR